LRVAAGRVVARTRRSTGAAAIRTGIVSIAASLAAPLLASCVGPLCGNDVVAESRSPDGRHVATHFERSCGATTPFVQVVTVHESGMPFPGEDTDEFLFTMRGRPAITLAWTGPDELVIRRPPVAADIFRTATRWNGVSVRYEE
jgi:hypothetical protein